MTGAIRLVSLCVCFTAIIGCEQSKTTTTKTVPSTDSLEIADFSTVDPSSAMGRLPSKRDSSSGAERATSEQDLDDEGKGPGEGGDQYDKIDENPFLRVADAPLSTFSIDVDTASYSKMRQYLLSARLPRVDSVRIEELLNYFQYEYTPPSQEDSYPFATHVAVTECPWNSEHRLARVALQGRKMENDVRPSSNLVFLIDSSGSMGKPNKLPLLKQGLELLLSQLGSDDHVAIVTYAGSAGLVLESTPASEKAEILTAMDRLSAGGSTNGGEGMELAYSVARANFIEGGTNRVLLCTDGDFNVGRTGTDQMIDFVEKQAKQGVELTVLGFGMGNLNDAMLEQISGRGNGNYAFVDTLNEARKVLSEQLTGTLVTIAKDVKIQVEFNPANVAGYRLIGYENRVLRNEDFQDDRKDAGEIGAGHSVTALYEIIPVGASSVVDLPRVDDLKYQTPSELTPESMTGDMFTLKLRFKFPGQDKSQLMEFVAKDDGSKFESADRDFQFATAVAGFGMLLRESSHCGDWSYDTVSEIAQSALGSDQYGLRREFVQLVSTAKRLDQ